MNQPPKIEQFLDDLALFPDRADRIQALISLSESFRPFAFDGPLPEDHRVPGCESEAFAWVFGDSGRLRLEFVVQNPQGVSAMALAALLKQSLDGEPVGTEQSLDEELVFQLFGRELSMGKSGGLMNMVRVVKTLGARLS